MDKLSKAAGVLQFGCYVSKESSLTCCGMLDCETKISQRHQMLSVVVFREFLSFIFLSCISTNYFNRRWDKNRKKNLARKQCVREFLGF
jgi:hypothetical protein